MPLLSTVGYCHCCREQSEFIANNSWLRDYYLCKLCNSIPRQRHLQFILDSMFSTWESLAIHESSPSNNFIARWSQNYSHSQFFSDTKIGAYKDNVRCENLEQLTFKENSFDLFITQDVFEHVFNPAQAAKEIMRVLKPGGAHIFTTPKYQNISESYARAKLKHDGTVINIKDPMYHGNPIEDGYSLVTWDYGTDFEYLLSNWSGLPVTTYVTKDQSKGIDAEFIEVFVIRKIAAKKTRKNIFSAFKKRIDKLLPV
jgi:SAM-dependent methyltransferase